MCSSHHSHHNHLQSKRQVYCVVPKYCTHCGFVPWLLFLRKKKNAFFRCFFFTASLHTPLKGRRKQFLNWLGTPNFFVFRENKVLWKNTLFTRSFFQNVSVIFLQNSLVPTPIFRAPPGLHLAFLWRVLSLVFFLQG